MARIRRIIIAGRGGRRGRSWQYLPRQGKGPGRRMSTKGIAHETLSDPLPREGTKLSTKNDVGRGQQIQALKEQAQVVEAGLSSLYMRIGKLEHGFTPSVFKASVDPDTCVGCGICQKACPAGAISVNEIARVDPKRCIGCGSCVEQCPMGALALHPLNTGYKELSRVAV